MKEKDYIFNGEAMEERLERIRECIYGCRTPISEYICGKSGALSDEKIEKLADELISRMRRYRIMDRVSVRFVRLYVYLVARAYIYGKKTTKTFGDVLNILRETVELKEMCYGSPQKLVLNGFLSCHREDGDGEYIWHSARPLGFFGTLDRSYEMLSDHSIGSELTEEELQETWNRNEICKKQESADRKAACEKYYEKYGEKYGDQTLESLFICLNPDLADDWDWMLYDPIREDWETEQQPAVDTEEEDLEQDGCPRFRLLSTEEREAMLEEEKQREERWKHSFPVPEKFLEACKEFLELFFLVDPSDIANALEKAVFLFLCGEGKTRLGDNEMFLKLYVQLDKVCRRAGKR